MMTPAQEKMFRAHWQQGSKKITELLKEREDIYVALIRNGDHPFASSDPRKAAIILMKHKLAEFSSDLDRQISHEADVDDFLKLIHLQKPAP